MKAPLPVILIAICAVAVFGGEAAKPRTGNITADVLVRFHRSDFRSVFCDYETLQSRIERRVAYVDRLHAKSVEIPLEQNSTVAAIMQKAGLEFRKRSLQLQFRLITQDAIYQSPTTSDKKLEEAFASRQMRPGDILMTTLLD